MTRISRKILLAFFYFQVRKWFYTTDTDRKFCFSNQTGIGNLSLINDNSWQVNLPEGPGHGQIQKLENFKILFLKDFYIDIVKLTMMWNYEKILSEFIQQQQQQLCFLS